MTAAPHDLAAIVDGVGRYKPSAARMARFLDTRGVLHLELQNGQRVNVRPLPEDRRWRMHDPDTDQFPPGVAPSDFVEVRGRIDGRLSRNVNRAGCLVWGRYRTSAPIEAWRPAR